LDILLIIAAVIELTTAASVLLLSLGLLPQALMDFVNGLTGA
jgi:hypothetical protein